jgi:hypothetical protein
MVIRDEAEAEILRLHQVEKWPVGTIAAHLEVHHSVVTRVIASGGAPPARPQRSARIDASSGNTSKPASRGHFKTSQSRVRTGVL